MWGPKTWLTTSEPLTWSSTVIVDFSRDTDLCMSPPKIYITLPEIYFPHVRRDLLTLMMWQRGQRGQQLIAGEQFAHQLRRIDRRLLRAATLPDTNEFYRESAARQLLLCTRLLALLQNLPLLPIHIIATMVK